MGTLMSSEAVAAAENPIGDLANATAQVGQRLGETAQAVDDIARSTCLLALDMALKADKPGNIGVNLVDASREVGRLAERTRRTLTELETMLRAVEGRTA
jgi:methyl-accepting chemotaxis protein